MAYICKPTKIPASTKIQLTKNMSPAINNNEMSKVPYKSILGQILYIAITTRPDISTAVSIGGKFAHNPGKQHWKAVLDIIKYLQGTRNHT